MPADYIALSSQILDARLIFCKFGCLTAIQEVPGSIPGYALEIFLEV